jgi:hypothetical protein
VRRGRRALRGAAAAATVVSLVECSVRNPACERKTDAAPIQHAMSTPADRSNTTRAPRGRGTGPSAVSVPLGFVLVLAYLSLPRGYLGATRSSLAGELSPSFLLLTAAIALAIFAVRGLVALRAPRVANVAAVVAVQILFVLRALEAALVDRFGSGFTPLVFAHLEVESLRLALAEGWAALAGATLLVTATSFAARRIPAPLLQGLRPARAALGYGLLLAGSSALLVVAGPRARGVLTTSSLLDAVEQYRESPANGVIRLSREERQWLKQLGFSFRPESRAPRIVRAPERPANLVLVILESFQANLTRHGGSSFPRLTPNLDRFARRFTYVPNAYNAATPTIGALVSMLCGVTPRVLGETFPSDNGFSSNFTCLTDLLAEQGYRQIFLGGAYKTFRGKGHFLRMHHYDEVYGWEDWEKTGRYDDRRMVWGLNDTDLVREAIARLGELKRSEPFHLTLLTVNTHRPGYPAPDCPPYRASPDNQVLNAFHCSDYAVGMLLAGLEQAGLLDSTVVVLMGDHTMFPGTWEQEAVGSDVASSYYGKVFLAFHSPLRELPRRIENPTFTPDLAPTVLELMGFGLSAPFPVGRSLLSDRPRYPHLVAADFDVEGGLMHPEAVPKPFETRSQCMFQAIEDGTPGRLEGHVSACERLRIAQIQEQWLAHGRENPPATAPADRR